MSSPDQIRHHRRLLRCARQAPRSEGHAASTSLHVPGQDPLPDFSDVARHPIDAQAHVLAAAIKMLDETRRGIIASECGTGKTAMSMPAIHKHAQRSVRKGGCNGNYRAICLCPDHLCEMEGGAGRDDPRRQGDAVRRRGQGL